MISVFSRVTTERRRSESTNLHLQKWPALLSAQKTDFGVLGNHDTIRMVPELEDMGIQMLLNENHAIERGKERIYLAGIDDAHFYRVDNIEKAATGIPSEIFRSCCRIRGGLSASILC